MRDELQRRAASLTLPYRVVVRAKLVLLAADGRSNREIAQRADMSADRVGDWRRRFAREGIEGLEDQPRSGRPRRFSPGRGRAGQGGRVRVAQDTRSSAVALQPR
ncbi:MAG TPA: helix-turn-helix domain-containing protein [Solirubrobacteraceae bacterium]|nr:helix-turn-helix domain-containing protein [Solirubrobacteraceae bacterium]